MTMGMAATGTLIAKVTDRTLAEYPRILDRFVTVLTGSAVVVGLRYLLFAGLAWMLGYVIFRRQWFHRKIVQKFPPGSEIRREVWWSIGSVLIFAAVGAATVALWRAGWTRMYWNNPHYGPVWFWASIGLAILIHDTYFYWTHRAIHHPRLFRFFHRTHHLSHNPSPWAAYAFSPAEAVIQAGIFPVVAFTIPIHPKAFALFMLWQIFFNVIGHTGYEYNRTWLMRSRLRFFINTPTNHAMHHEKMVGNYGLYFSFWDYLMGTQHREYEQRFIEVTQRPRETAAVPSLAAHGSEVAG